MRYQTGISNEEMNLLLEGDPTGPLERHRAMLVGVDGELLRHVAGILRSECFTVQYCQEPVMALNRCRRERFDLVISAVQLPGLDGVELLTLIKYLLPRAHRVLLGEATDRSILIRAINSARVDAFVEAPFCDAEFRSLVTGMFPDGD